MTTDLLKLTITEAVAGKGDISDSYERLSFD